MAPEGGSVDLEKKLEKLRRLTLESVEIKKAVECFHDDLAMREEFLTLGVTGQNPLLEEIVRAAARKAVPNFTVTAFRMIHLPEHHFWHGSAAASQSGFAVFYYFDAMGVGSCQLSPSVTSSESHFVRFSGVPLDQPVLPGKVTRGQS